MSFAHRFSGGYGHIKNPESRRDGRCPRIKTRLQVLSIRLSGRCHPERRQRVFCAAVVEGPLYGERTASRLVRGVLLFCLVRLMRVHEWLLFSFPPCSPCLRGEHAPKSKRRPDSRPRGGTIPNLMTSLTSPEHVTGNVAQILVRIHRRIVDAHFVMQVCSCTTAAHADVSDDLPLTDVLSVGHCKS